MLNNTYIIKVPRYQPAAMRKGKSLFPYGIVIQPKDLQDLKVYIVRKHCISTSTDSVPSTEYAVLPKY
jgi:hypothetical protein